MVSYKRYLPQVALGAVGLIGLAILLQHQNSLPHDQLCYADLSGFPSTFDIVILLAFGWTAVVSSAIIYLNTWPRVTKLILLGLLPGVWASLLVVFVNFKCAAFF